MQRVFPAVTVMIALAAGPAFAQTKTTAPTKTTTKQTTTKKTTKTATTLAAKREVWRKAMLKTAKPKERGCFTAAYPNKTWHEVTCKEPPHKVYPPVRRGASRGGATHGEQVGNGPDFSPDVPGHITEADGSFDSMSGVTSECAVACPNQVCPANPACHGSNANQFSLQLNTKPFTTSTCSGSPDSANCQGWEQFVYSSSGSGFIQYWLLNYGPSGTECPMPRGASCVNGEVFTDGWCPFQFSTGGEVFCVVNGPHSADAPSETISSLTQIKLTGDAAGAGGMADDSITVTVGGTAHAASGANYFPDLGSRWQEVEFNVFGDGNSDQAVFNSGSTVHVRTAVNSGSSSGPGCDDVSFTGESSNLTLVNMAPTSVSGNLPALLFSESFPAPAGGAASCADATSVGDTHITSFDGLLYDFQASGDFVLARSGNFEVQTRQASGAPTWPLAALNEAVAVRMGATRVAIRVKPNRLEIDGTARELADNEPVVLPTGVQVTRHGNAYVVSDEDGDRVRATLNSNAKNAWIDVKVGTGHTAAAELRGLLGNPKGNKRVLETSRGEALKEPVAFDELYHKYAESWRVAESESLFAEGRTERVGIPEKAFFSRDLSPAAKAKAKAACLKAGVKGNALLEACELDHAVLGGRAAVHVFAKAVAPKKVVRPAAVLKKEPAEREVAAVR